MVVVKRANEKLDPSGFETKPVKVCTKPNHVVNKIAVPLAVQSGTQSVCKCVGLLNTTGYQLYRVCRELRFQSKSDGLFTGPSKTAQLVIL